MVLKTKVVCPFCEGKAVLSKESTKLFKGLVTLKDNPIYKCEKCGEKFATAEAVDKHCRTQGKNPVLQGEGLGVKFYSP